MTKSKKSTVFTCSSCGYTQARWLGRCPECGGWNTFSETAVQEAGGSSGSSASHAPKNAKPVALSKVAAMENERLTSGIGEFDRVLGGGIMKKSAVLIGGEPGIGKSTLLLQAADKIAALKTASEKHPVLYVSGEESASQIRARADRIGCSSIGGITILCTSNLTDILLTLDSLCPTFVIVDSIQTVYTPDAGLVPGTVNQLKYCALELVQWVKEHDAVLCMSAHVTKEGYIAGPKSLEHLVDTVVSFERNDDEVRFLRAQKNRFGAIDELGIFAMRQNGLQEIEDPSALFITRRTGELPSGIAFAPVFEGSRVFLVEIQALTVGAKAGITRVYSDKIDSSRVSRTAAVIEKRTGLQFSDQDIYINVAGGIRLTDSAIDCALACALYSARTGIALKTGTALIGELSLAGEIRPVMRIKQRAKTAESLGFNRIFSPDEGTKTCTDIKQMVAEVFGAH